VENSSSSEISSCSYRSHGRVESETGHEDQKGGVGCVYAIHCWNHIFVLRSLVTELIKSLKRSLLNPRKQNSP